jgi:hypothetical protein
MVNRRSSCAYTILRLCSLVYGNMVEGTICHPFSPIRTYCFNDVRKWTFYFHTHVPHPGSSPRMEKGCSWAQAQKADSAIMTSSHRAVDIVCQIRKCQSRTKEWIQSQRLESWWGWWTKQKPITGMENQSRCHMQSSHVALPQFVESGQFR